MSSFELDLSSLDIGAAASSETSTGRSTSPICVLVIGMAGSGKTALMQRINLEMVERKTRAYYINLDPATTAATGIVLFTFYASALP